MKNCSVYFIVLILIFYSLNCVNSLTYNTEYAKSWKWSKNSSYTNSVRSNQFSSYSHSFLFAEQPAGIDIKDDGTLFSIDLIEQQQTSPGRVCMGVMEVANWSKTLANKDSDITSYSILACTDRNNYFQDQSVNVISPFYRLDEVGGKFDIIVGTDFMIVSNERYGEFTNIQFTLDSSKKYFPIIYSYSNSPVYPIYININSCYSRCGTCEDFEFEKCLTCKITDVKQEDAPSCDCKTGFTDYYNHKKNENCQAEPNYFIDQNWKWINQQVPENQEAESIGQYEYLTGGQKQLYVDLQDGLEAKQDGTKWTVELVRQNLQADYFCVGIMHTGRINTSFPKSHQIAYCSDMSRIDYYSVGSSFVEYGSKDGFGPGIKNMKFDVIFTATEITVTNIPYHGNTDYKWEWDPAQKFFPVVLTNLQTVARVHKCSPRCETCEYMNPHVCITCKNPSTRGDAPDCACNTSLQDTFRIPDDHHIQSTCIAQYQYHIYSPPQWIWKSQSTNIEEENGFFTTTSGYSKTYVDLGNTGIEVKLDAVKWTIKIDNHEGTNTSQWMCFGIQKTDRLQSISWDHSTAYGALVCTDNRIITSDSISSKTRSGKMPQASEATGYQLDFFYNYGFLRVSDAAYGGDFYHEFQLNPNMNFVPHIHVYSVNDMQPQIFQVHNCSPNCFTCWAFEPKKCLQCNDQVNRPQLPGCECKAGYEDIYDSKHNTECRVIPPWYEFSPPKWIYYTESDYAEELVDLEEDSHQNGYFKTKNTGYSQIKLEKNNVLDSHTKWTVKIIQHNAASRVCFGVIKQELITLDFYGHHSPQATCQCTDASTTVYYSDPKTYTTYKGLMVPRKDQSGQIYDIYYENHRLVISNEDRGGYFRREFELTTTMKYTPHLEVQGVDTIVQVKGCSSRCKTCYDWDPEKCIECVNTLYRQPAPSCRCEETYEDIYDEQFHQNCRQIEVYNEMKSPFWNWMTYSNDLQEDIQDNKQNHGTFTTTVRYGNMVIEDFKPIDDYSKWTVKILKHPPTGRIGLCVSESDRVRSVNHNTYQVSYHQCFTTDNNIYSYDGFAGANTNTFIIEPMPKDSRETLNGEIFDLYYKKDLLYITNEDYRGADGGRLIRAKIELNPNLSYTPYITIDGQFTQIQVKSCSKRCSGCLDWRPRQCIKCSDPQNRESAPCCAAKYGFTDYYNYEIHEKVILKPDIPLANYPQFQWEQMTNCPYCEEEQSSMGTHRVTQSQIMRLVPKDYILDQNSGPIMWEVKIKEASPSGYMCFGVIQADRNLATTTLGYTMTACTQSQNTVYYSTSYGGKHPTAQYRILGPFPKNRQDLIGEKLQIIYTNDMVQITNEAYGGTINIEIDIDPNFQFRPWIMASGPEEQVQVRACNVKCETCEDWTPNTCLVCSGQNRTIPPLCGCKSGFTDIYYNKQHKDCIPIKNHYHPHPTDWVWKTRHNTEADDYVQNLGNGYWQIMNTYDFIYADLGRTGVYGGPGGTKWSIEITKVENTSAEVGVGITKNENIITMNPVGNNRGTMSGILFNSYPVVSTKQNKYTAISKESANYPIQEQIGMRYDLYFEDGLLKVSNTAYGYQRHYEFEMIEQLNFTPFIPIYSPGLYKTVVNVKPCHWKCAECDNSVSTVICTKCLDLTTRIDNSDCTCKDGYYEDPQGFYKCLPCDKSCASCSGPETCITCILTPDRNNAPPNCSCKKGFYQNMNAQCGKCHQSCEKCDNATECTKCKVEAYRDQVTCICLDGYYDDPISGFCTKCPPQCRTCVNGTGVCTDCACDRILFDGVNTACPCPDNSFGVSESSGTCDICQPPCSTCTSKTVCTACDISGLNRAGPPTCLCEPGHFEDQFKNCRPCMTGCSICETYAYRCKLCKSDPNRSQDVKSCACNEGFMDDPITGVCVESSCPIKCAICQPGSNEICQVCTAAVSRKDITNNCDCSDGYYEIEEEECEQCPLPCGNCSSADVCITCISTVGRDPAPGCQCSDGFYEDPSNICMQCHYKCNGCTMNAENCTACVLQPNRKTSGDCSCNAGYSEDSVSKSCVSLAVCAAKCETCSNTEPSDCTVCTMVPNSYRKSQAFNCICQDGYYDSGSAVCSPCKDFCGTCNQIDKCLTCKYTDTHRLGPEFDCVCDEGFEENSSNVCIQKVSGCPQENGRSPDGDCLCLPGFFENISLKCQPCNQQCKTCSGTADSCEQCTEGYKQDSAPNCIKCSNICGDCGLEPTECTSCVAGRTQPPLCDCLPHHYTTADDPACYPCEPQCVNCAGSASTCTVCKGYPEKRYSAPNCECWEGYYNDVKGRCQKCDYKCLTCKGAADYCTICRNGKDRILSPPYCNCKPGTYETPYNNNCEFCSTECQVTEVQYRRMLFGPSLTEQQIDLKCSSFCKSCQNEADNCLVCQPGKNTTMVPPLCDCLPGFYLSKSVNKCLECKGKLCQKCNSQNGKCETCSQENMVVNVNGDCQCQKGFIMDETIFKCQSCYIFQGNCVLGCPQGTIAMKDTLQCVNEELIQEEEFYTNTYLYGGITSILICMVLIHKVLTYFFS